MRPRDHRRVNAHRDRRRLARTGVRDQFADRQQLDEAADLAGGGDVGGGHLGDAFTVDVGRRDPAVEGQTRQDGRLGRGVEALHVGGRVGLGVAELLRLGQDVAEPRALGLHLVQDVVGGAVDDADHRRDLVADQGLAQRPDDRDGPGDGGLEVEVDLGRLRGREQGGAVLGEQRLVRRDDRGAGGHRPKDQGPGRLDPADELDHDVDATAVDRASRRRS